MQVKSIECQIAQAQLRRYLTGEEMPSSIVTDLETHLRHCDDCMASAHSLRESLQSVIANKVTGRPTPQPRNVPVHTTIGTTRTADEQEPEAQAPTHAAVQTPVDLLDAPDEQFKPKKGRKGSNARTVFYSGALALLLVLMSTVFRDPTKLFGPKADSVRPDTPPKEAKAEPTTTKTETEAPKATEVKPTTDQAVASTTAPTAQPPATTSGTEAAKAQGPLPTSGLIVADSVAGTKIVPNGTKKPDPKPRPKPRTQRKPSGGTTMKVYPPAGQR